MISYSGEPGARTLLDLVTCRGMKTGKKKGDGKLSRSYMLRHLRRGLDSEAKDFRQPSLYQSLDSHLLMRISVRKKLSYPGTGDAAFL